MPITLGFPDVPLLVDNDANALTLADAPPARACQTSCTSRCPPASERGSSRAALQRGVHGAVGEIGHNPVADGGGVVCRCGNLDCLEAVPSDAALVATLRAGHDVAEVPGVVALVRAGDSGAVALVRHTGRRIGEVLAVAVNLLNPQVVVFGGDLAEAFEPLLARVREQVYRRAIVPVTRDLAIEQSALGPSAGIVGCAAMALAEVLSPRAVDAALVEP